MLKLRWTHSAGTEAETDEQKDLSNQDGKCQVGMNMVTLVTDGANGPVYTEKKGMNLK